MKTRTTAIQVTIPKKWPKIWQQHRTRQKHLITKLNQCIVQIYLHIDIEGLSRLFENIDRYRNRHVVRIVIIVAARKEKTAFLNNDTIVILESLTAPLHSWIIHDQRLLTPMQAIEILLASLAYRRSYLC